MPDARYCRAPFWKVVHDSLLEWLRSDDDVAALVTGTKGDETVVDIAEGLTPAIPANGIRLLRGDEGEEPLTGYRVGWLPASLTIVIAMWARASVPSQRDEQMSADSSWAASAALEAAVKASLRAYFDPSRNMTEILGAPYSAVIRGTISEGKDYWPAVASAITIELNRGIND